MTLIEKNRLARLKLRDIKEKSIRVRYYKLAQTLGVSESWISKWLNGKWNANEIQLNAIFEYILIESYIYNEVERLQKGQLTTEEMSKLLEE